jgi:hypothetical protein
VRSKSLSIRESWLKIAICTETMTDSDFFAPKPKLPKTEKYIIFQISPRSQISCIQIDSGIPRWNIKPHFTQSRGGGGGGEGGEGEEERRRRRRRRGGGGGRGGGEEKRFNEMNVSKIRAHSRAVWGCAAPPHSA